MKEGPLKGYFVLFWYVFMQAVLNTGFESEIGCRGPPHEGSRGAAYPFRKLDVFEEMDLLENVLGARYEVP